MNGTCAPEALQSLAVKDDVFARLMSPDTTDDTVQIILKFLFAEWAVLLRRLLEDHLPGGKFHSIEENSSCTVT